MSVIREKHKNTILNLATACNTYIQDNLKTLKEYLLKLLNVTEENAFVWLEIPDEDIIMIYHIKLHLNLLIHLFPEIVELFLSPTS